MPSASSCNRLINLLLDDTHSIEDIARELETSVVGLDALAAHPHVQTAAAKLNSICAFRANLIAARALPIAIGRLVAIVESNEDTGSAGELARRAATALIRFATRGDDAAPGGPVLRTGSSPSAPSSPRGTGVPPVPPPSTSPSSTQPPPPRADDALSHRTTCRHAPHSRGAMRHVAIRSSSRVKRSLRKLSVTQSTPTHNQNRGQPLSHTAIRPGAPHHELNDDHNHGQRGPPHRRHGPRA